ncbi:hypothetical protein OH77DRAFT_1419897 [Trametes cingulata]|nr:hypothetical protein OH77DRAFT_1419897 [Trametes cingulata]
MYCPFCRALCPVFCGRSFSCSFASSYTSRARCRRWCSISWNVDVVSGSRLAVVYARAIRCAAFVNVLEARRGRWVSDVAAWADALEKDTQVAKCVHATFTALGRSSYPTCAGLRSRGWMGAYDRVMSERAVCRMFSAEGMHFVRGARQ